MNDFQVNSADKIRMGKKVRIWIRIFDKLALLFVDPKNLIFITDTKSKDLLFIGNVSVWLII